MLNPMIPTEDNVLTVAETARLLGVSQFTLLRMRQRPDADGLPYVKLSPHRLGYVRRDVLAFLAMRRVGVLSKAA
jgi:predicted DNA-binding transcriptional regulator AlpA